MGRDIICDDEWNLTRPDPESEYDCIGSNVNLLMKCIILYDDIPELFNTAINDVTIDELNQKTSYGYTPLDLPLRFIHPEDAGQICKRLIDKGANPVNVLNLCGVFGNGINDELIWVFINHGLDVLKKDIKGNDVMPYAIMYNRHDIIDYVFSQTNFNLTKEHLKFKHISNITYGSHGLEKNEEICYLNNHVRGLSYISELLFEKYAILSKDEEN